MRTAFGDPVSGKICHLDIPAGGRIFPGPGQPKIGVAHPGCPELADLALELDAFYCPACRLSGRVSGMWALALIESSRLEARRG